MTAGSGPASQPADPGADDGLPVPAGVDPSVPSPARLYDYYLGGRINYRADRDAAERIRADLPEISDMAWANRGFHQRAAKWLAQERGITPVHRHRVRACPPRATPMRWSGPWRPDARVVYVDNDPMVRAYAQGLLTDSRFTTFVFGRPARSGQGAERPPAPVAIDFTEPAGLLMTAVLHFVPDEADPWGLVSRYLAALAPGSYLALSHVTDDNVPPQAVAHRAGRVRQVNREHPPPVAAEVERFFTGPGPGAALAGRTAAAGLHGRVGGRGPRTGRQRRVTLGVRRGGPGARAAARSDRSGDCGQ